MVNISLDDLINFLKFLNDKVEKCYKKETTIAIDRFIKNINSR